MKIRKVKKQKLPEMTLMQLHNFATANEFTIEFNGRTGEAFVIVYEIIIDSEEVERRRQ